MYLLPYPLASMSAPSLPGFRFHCSSRADRAPLQLRGKASSSPFPHLTDQPCLSPASSNLWPSALTSGEGGLGCRSRASELRKKGRWERSGRFWKDVGKVGAGQVCWFKRSLVGPRAGYTLHKSEFCAFTKSSGQGLARTWCGEHGKANPPLVLA